MGNMTIYSIENRHCRKKKFRGKSSYPRTQPRQAAQSDRVRLDDPDGDQPSENQREDVPTGPQNN